MKKNNKKGFTLVELVIVIAVIAVLSAILVPTFGKVISDANENARREDARIAYQNFIIEHSEDDANDVLANKAYILIDAEEKTQTVDGKKIAQLSSTKYVYKIENGALEEISGMSLSGLCSEIKAEDSSTPVESIPVVVADEGASIVAQTAYSLGKAGMYIVFAA